MNGLCSCLLDICNYLSIDGYQSNSGTDTFSYQTIPDDDRDRSRDKEQVKRKKLRSKDEPYSESIIESIRQQTHDEVIPAALAKFYSIGK